MFRKTNRIGFYFLLFVSSTILAQNLEKQEHIANSYMRDANELYAKSNFSDAEVAYKKSVATYPANPKTIYNLANTMMRQKRYKEAIKQYNYLAKNSKSTQMQAQSYHNIGNANMGLNDFQKAVDAYKNALRKNPKDEETRYNLAYAQELLKQQQQQNKDNKDKQNKDDKNKDKKNQDQEKKDKEDKEKKDDKNKEDDNKDKKKDQDKKDEENKGDDDKKEESKKDPKPKDKEGDDKKQQQQPRPGKLSPQQAKQLLEALQNEEKKTQDKVNLKRIKGKPVKTEKDW